jgi:tRNA/rRNA methyltransferase
MLERPDRPPADPVEPAIVLVEPQLAENIGMAARAMANFGLSTLRLVSPRGGWPKKGAHAAASGAQPILESAGLFGTAGEAVADCRFVLATTARPRDQMKRVLGPQEALGEAARRAGAGERVGILFGRERTGLTNDEVSLADAILTFPVEPRFASLNLAQAVLLAAYEWRRAFTGPALPFAEERRSPPAPRGMLISLFEHLEGELDRIGHFPADKRVVMARNMRDILIRMGMSEQDVRSLRGILRALAEGRRIHSETKKS